MELREKYKENEPSLTTLSLAQTYASNFTDHRKTLEAKMDKPNSPELLTAVHSPSSLKYKKCKPSDQAKTINRYESTQSTRKCSIGGSEDEKEKNFLGMSCTRRSVTNDDKENVEQESIKIGSEEDLIKSDKLKCPKEVNPSDIKKNLASPYDGLINGHCMTPAQVDKFRKLMERQKKDLTNEQCKCYLLEAIPSNKYSEGPKKRMDLLRDDSPTINEKHAEGTVDTTVLLDDFVIKRRNTPMKRSPPLIIMKSSRNNPSNDSFKFNKDDNIS
ncbi:uncharacterized protein LOC119633435 [Glossina fuscipes]|uniref:Uncharacterized protein LOC119633435 n=1 Tax=Glossina fuscipes TaxID=7396 RepID=A0A8U0WCM4_9MUSC|nr:uncharacterized protein LOC119633435 [Glossina fuscipes]